MLGLNCCRLFSVLGVSPCLQLTLRTEPFQLSEGYASQSWRHWAPSWLMQKSPNHLMIALLALVETFSSPFSWGRGCLPQIPLRVAPAETAFWASHQNLPGQTGFQRMVRNSEIPEPLWTPNFLGIPKPSLKPGSGSSGSSWNKRFRLDFLEARRGPGAFSGPSSAKGRIGHHSSTAAMSNLLW